LYGRVRALPTREPGLFVRVFRFAKIFRPFPTKIPEAIFDKLGAACIHVPGWLLLEINGQFQSHWWLLDQHYQINTNNWDEASEAACARTADSQEAESRNMAVDESEI